MLVEKRLYIAERTLLKSFDFLDTIPIVSTLMSYLSLFTMLTSGNDISLIISPGLIPSSILIHFKSFVFLLIELISIFSINFVICCTFSSVKLPTLSIIKFCLSSIRLTNFPSLSKAWKSLGHSIPFPLFSGPVRI